MTAPASSAVVARRHEPALSLDYFPTPPWATRAFIEHVFTRQLGAADGDHVWEPACGEGHMAAVLAERFKVTCSDIFPYGFGQEWDFLDGWPTAWPMVKPKTQPPRWIVTNPPFNAAEAFARQGLAIASEGVCLLVRTQWLEGAARHKLFDRHPPACVAIYCERVPMHRGRWEPAGTTASSYAWVCWWTRRTTTFTHLTWIPPGQRKRLTRPDDARRFGAKGDAPLLDGGA